MIIGVSDSGKVLGVDIGKKTIENLANRIKQITDPMTYPSIYEEPGYYSDLYGDLCQLFRADNVDVVLLNQADLALQARVVLEGHCILEGDGAADLEERVLARHADMAAWRQENWSVTRQLARRGAMGEKI
ncbi:ATP-binding protein [Dehalococcoidia bacterium]|nr:ATP-binding protein [Dehalococcoidia bacterium]